MGMTAAAEDREMLESLLADRRLTPEEREAFAGMLERLKDGAQHCLTSPQREWARDRCEDLELLGEAAQNLWSSGRVPRGIPDKSARQLESGTATIRGREFKLERPLRPPGR